MHEIGNVNMGFITCQSAINKVWFFSEKQSIIFAVNKMQYRVVRLKVKEKKNGPRHAKMIFFRYAI